MAEQGFGEMLLERLFGPRGTGVSAQTQAELQRLGEGTPPPPPPPDPNVKPANTGLSTRPLTAREAAAKGDEKLLEALRRRQRGLGAKPAPPAPSEAATRRMVGAEGVSPKVTFGAAVAPPPRPAPPKPAVAPGDEKLMDFINTPSFGGAKIRR